MKRLEIAASACVYLHLHEPHTKKKMQLLKIRYIQNGNMSLRKHSCLMLETGYLETDIQTLEKIQPNNKCNNNRLDICNQKIIRIGVNCKCKIPDHREP